MYSQEAHIERLPYITFVLADDFPEWRARVRSMLPLGSRIVGEACDGPETVSKAAQLQPDIVILDIGLPGFNGIQAAKLIQQKCPQTRVIFLSQQTDSDIVEGALAAADGSVYVVKAKAKSGLPSAITTVLQAATAART